MKGDLTEQRLPRPGEPVWRSYVEEWDRALRAANKPVTTRYNMNANELTGHIGEMVQFQHDGSVHRGRLMEVGAAPEDHDEQDVHVLIELPTTLANYSCPVGKWLWSKRTRSPVPVRD